MWAIRFLSGHQSGKIYPLKSGRNTIGRAPECDVKIDSQSVSKEHAQIYVTEDKIILTDLGSSNGTYVGGTRVQNYSLKMGDKISFHDVICDVVQISHQLLQQKRMQQSMNSQMYLGNSNTAHDVHHSSEEMRADPTSHPSQQIQAQWQRFQGYINQVAMPGVYSLARRFDYQMVIATLLGLYVLVVTVIATIPMMDSTKTAIQNEGGRRAITIARNLAFSNRRAIIDNVDTSVSTRQAELEEGVQYALIISNKDGHTIAPVNRSNYASSDCVTKVRRFEREDVIQLNGSTLCAGVPIMHYNPDFGTQSAIAHAVVVYDMASLALSGIQMFNLVIKILAIGLLFGLVLYFFVYRLIEQPLIELNGQLDQALRENQSDVTTSFRFPVLKELITKVNAALSRMGTSQEVPIHSNTYSKEREASNLVETLPMPALAISAIDLNIISANETFSRLIGGNVNLHGKSIMEIPDPPTQQHIRDLIEQLKANGDSTVQSEIPFPNGNYIIFGNTMMGSNEPAYYLIVLQPLDVEGGGH